MYRPDNTVSQRVGNLGTLYAFLRQMPKIDLHRHLEGSLRLQTLADIATRHGIDLPAYSIEKLRPYVQVTEDKPDFHSFLAKFRLLRQFYHNQEAVMRVAYEAVADAAEDNICYMELRFNPVALARAQRFPLDNVVRWVCMAVEQAQKDYDITARLILQIGRDEDLRTADEIVQLALDYQDQGVVGVDLAGDEINYPPHRFVTPFRRAREGNLGITVHAGEAGSAKNVHDAIRLLHASRIGHGVRLVEDSNVVRLAREQGVTLEICLTSNLQTGVVHTFTQHPLPDLITLGVRTTINTDDPSVSDTTLTDEYMVAMAAVGLELEQVRKSIFTALEAAFIPEGEKRQLCHKFAAWNRQLL